MSLYQALLLCQALTCMLCKSHAKFCSVFFNRFWNCSSKKLGKLFKVDSSYRAVTQHAKSSHLGHLAVFIQFVWNNFNYSNSWTTTTKHVITLLKMGHETPDLWFGPRFNLISQQRLLDTLDDQPRTIYSLPRKTTDFSCVCVSRKKKPIGKHERKASQFQCGTLESQLRWRNICGSWHCS